MPRPDFCELALYGDPAELSAHFGGRIAAADAVIVGSYVPDGVAVLDFVAAAAGGVRAFYDIDTPITVATLERGDCSYLAASQVPTLDLYLSFTGGPLLDHLARRFGARRPRALYCAVDETVYRPLVMPPRWDLGYLGTFAADRQPALERLLIAPARRLPHRRFVVAGPQYPASIDWPANVERIEHLPPSEHVAFYARQLFTLNVTRTDMVRTGWSPSVRIFEAGACGTPIISDRWDGLQELLPEIAIADGADDVIDALEYTDEAAWVRTCGRRSFAGTLAPRVRRNWKSSSNRRSKERHHASKPRNDEVGPAGAHRGAGTVVPQLGLRRHPDRAGPFPRRLSALQVA